MGGGVEHSERENAHIKRLHFSALPQLPPKTHTDTLTAQRARTEPGLDGGEMAMAEEWAEGGRWEGLKEREGAGETSGFLHSTAPTGRPQGGVIVGWFTYG